MGERWRSSTKKPMDSTEIGRERGRGQETGLPVKGEMICKETQPSEGKRKEESVVERNREIERGTEERKEKENKERNKKENPIPVRRVEKIAAIFGETMTRKRETEKKKVLNQEKLESKTVFETRWG